MPPHTARLDPLRYAQRCLDEMARRHASVPVPSSPPGEEFAPPPHLRALPREGAALSLRLFSDAPDDATRFVLGDAATLRLAPIPARATAFFEAFAASLAYDGEDDVLVGFPLVRFTQHGVLRAAPLLSAGAVRARWRLDDAPWTLPHGARAGDAIAAPTALVLDASGRDADDGYALHAGVWGPLFGVDGDALGAVARAGRAGIGALVRAATRALAEGVDDADELTVDGAPPTREDLRALCAAAVARANPRHDASCHPHAMAMILPRGDPTRGLRTELKSLLAARAPEGGPLAVYLGAKAAPRLPAPLWSHGATPPTPSQVTAARALEGARDLVAVRGPPGCGKTALLHHVTAQAIVARALDDTWRRAPPAEAPWALVVASTNNAAVDHALAPFVADPLLPVGLRLGSRRVLAEVTAPALDAALAALDAPGALDLDTARARFEALAAPIRALHREREALGRARHAHEAQRAKAAARAERLRAALRRPRAESVPEGVSLAMLDEALGALREHEEAASKLEQIYRRGANASEERARAKWDEANARRGPRIAPTLAALSLATPFGPLDAQRPWEDLATQRAAMAASVDGMLRARDALRAEGRARELAALEQTLADASDVVAPEPDPSLVGAALSLRDAWARSHRAALIPRLREAAASLRDEVRAERGRAALRALAPLFPLAGCTLLSMRASFPLDDDVIDRLVIDEAGQCAPAYAIPALARARRAMFTGDTAQLPPVYTLDDRADARLARGLDEAAVAPFRMGSASTTSAQSVAEARAAAGVTLVEHFRSQPEIVALASAWSGYSLDVRTPRRGLGDRSSVLCAPVRVIAVQGVGARASEGVVNEPEARRAVALVEALVRDGVAPADIAVLTPFVGQSARIERALHALGLSEGVLVRTVHKLQGGERRVVIFSVTATARRHLRWLSERPHLLHVAASRAQDHLIVLVDPDRAREEPALAPLLRVEAQPAARSRATGQLTIGRAEGNSAR